MALNIGNLPVKQVYVGSTPVKSVYVGSKLVWPTVVQITGTSGMTSRNQLKDAVTALGLDYRTVTHLPFEIDTSQATSLLDLFNGWAALVVAPEMTTLQVTDMGGLFRGCTALEYVGDLQTSNVTNAGYMFNACPALTDGNVRLLGKHPNVSTTAMINHSGLTREPWYNADGTPREVVQITLGRTYDARNQFWGILSERGLDKDTITEIPFDIDLVGSGLTNAMFYGFARLKTAPLMNTSQVTDMNNMFRNCSALTYVPDMDTSNVKSVSSMFTNCSSLTDGNVRLIGRHPQVSTAGILTGSGLTRVPFYDTNGNPI